MAVPRVAVDRRDGGTGGRTPTWRDRLAEAFGVWEWITTVGVVMLLVGLWFWFGGGPALAGVGALVVWMGIAGGRAAAAATIVVDEADGGGRRGPTLEEVG